MPWRRVKAQEKGTRGRWARVELLVYTVWSGKVLPSGNSGR